MTRIAWKAIPYASPDYELAGEALRKRWARLHQGDCEIFPSAASLRKIVARHPELDLPVSIEQASERLQQAWQAYHRGEFGKAVELGRALGPLGANVANKATNIYATYLETAEKRKLALFLEAAKHAEALQAVAPSLPNAWYLHAQALGRYAQGISIVAALAQGLGGKVKASLEQAIAREPGHADAHIGLGAYHAEVIGKVGSLIGGLTYGASAKEAVAHFEKALALSPHSAIARIEYADGLLLLFGRSKLIEARRLYRDAANIRPADAMERLDAERALAGIED
jgi:tetratricopeptide (TPR) repeat protein